LNCFAANQPRLACGEKALDLIEQGQRLRRSSVSQLVLQVSQGFGVLSGGRDEVLELCDVAGPQRLGPVDRDVPGVLEERALPASRVEIATQIVSGLALIGALRVGLLASLLAGLLVYELVHALAPGRNSRIVSRHTGKIIVVAFIATVIIVGAGAAILGLLFFCCPLGLKAFPSCFRKWQT